MSKKMMEAFIKGQYNALNAKDNKERLGYMVAGIKDGKFYSHNGTEYGVFDEDAPDTEFIAESDLELSRITGSKIATITIAMQKFFDKYNSDEVEEDGSEENTDEVTEEAPKKPKKDKSDGNESQADDRDVGEPEVDVEVVEKAIKKAIKKGDFKKAQKLIDKLGGHKKLQKKLDKAQK